jgi:hypothetical protein
MARTDRVSDRPVEEDILAQDIDRDEFLRTCEQLGHAEDGQVLTAARALNAQLTAAGIGWDEVLRSESGWPSSEQGLGEDDAGETDEELAVGEAPANPESLTLIERLLGRSDLSADLREELEDYKSDIKDGSFTAADGRYLKALASRLSGSKKGD